jgi:hypothetical protein
MIVSNAHAETERERERACYLFQAEETKKKANLIANGC